jgi:cytochrome P450
MLPGRANGVLPDCDLAESNLAKEEPDIAEEIDGVKEVHATAEARADVLASFCARIRSCENPLLVFDAICFATGVLSLDGCSQSELARRHGVTRAAFSKIATQWVKTFNLPPSRGMKSRKARRKYSELTRKKWHDRRNRQSGRKDQ